MLLQKFLPTWQGSKARWINRLAHHHGKDFVELFAGSGVISASLAKTAILNDIDPYIYKILSRFDELKYMETFTEEDYFKYRKEEDWWKYSFFLLKMSFSSMFRYSKNGFNVPFNKKCKELKVMHEYKAALRRWEELSPIVTNLSYLDFPIEDLIGKVVISDPPYEMAKAGYNKKFDYHEYWHYIKSLESKCELIIFEYTENMPFRTPNTQGLVPNGKERKTIEGMYEFKNSQYPGHAGDKLFHELFPHLIKIGKFKYRLGIKIIQLQVDYYSSERTDNLYIDNVGDVNYYAYLYTTNKDIFIYDIEDMKTKNNSIVDRKDLTPIIIERLKSPNVKIEKVTLEDFY